MKLEFTPDELKQYFTGKRSHHFAEKTRELEEEMRVHADGIFPDDLIKERRPNEPLEVQTYREKIFVPKTKPYFSKIESTLQKIRRSSDWSIKYGDGAFDKIVEEEKLDVYAEKKFPVFTSVTNWAFSLLLRNYLIDPNALVLVAPIEINEEENKFVKPVATIFNSEHVIDYIEDDYAVVRNKVGCTYNDDKGNPKDGESYYIITTAYVQRYDQINNKKQFAVKFDYQHGLEELPIFKIGAVAVDVYGPHSLYESRVSGILPEFNEALREYSDLQAAKVLHLYPERWEYTQNECTNCKGSGRRMETVNNESCETACNTCQGQGYVATGPYSKMLIKPSSADQLQVPTPPAGFVEKDVEIIKVQEESVQNHITNGLAAINFEFIASTPLNQSGTAKEVDKDELNTTVHSIAEDIVRVIDFTYYFIALYRYGVQYSKKEIEEMLPDIAVPEKFDILSTKYYDEQITSAKKNKLNPAIINALEISYATKAFNNDLDISEHIGLLLKLDPLSGISEDDKNSRLQNSGVTQLDYIVSSNINKFVNEALEEDIKFKDLDPVKQKEAIYKKAQEQLDAAAQQIIDEEDNTEDTEESKEVRETDTQAARKPV